MPIFHITVLHGGKGVKMTNGLLRITRQVLKEKKGIHDVFLLGYLSWLL